MYIYLFFNKYKTLAYYIYDKKVKSFKIDGQIALINYILKNFRVGKIYKKKFL